MFSAFIVFAFLFYFIYLSLYVSWRLVNGILSERHDILKRLRSDRQDAVCAQSKFPQAEFKDVVAKGSAPRFGDLMKMIRFLIS